MRRSAPLGLLVVPKSMLKSGRQRRGLGRCARREVDYALPVSGDNDPPAEQRTHRRMPHAWWFGLLCLVLAYLIGRDLDGGSPGLGTYAAVTLGLLVTCGVESETDDEREERQEREYIKASLTITHLDVPPGWGSFSLEPTRPARPFPRELVNAEIERHMEEWRAKRDALRGNAVRRGRGFAEREAISRAREVAIEEHAIDQRRKAAGLPTLDELQALRARNAKARAPRKNKQPAEPDLIVRHVRSARDAAGQPAIDEAAVRLRRTEQINARRKAAGLPSLDEL